MSSQSPKSAWKWISTGCAIVLIPIIAVFYNSCGNKGLSSKRVTLQSAPPSPTPNPNPNPNPTPNPNPSPTPLQNQWLSLVQSNPPAARTAHSAVWTGNRMIIFGGHAGGAPFGDGASFNPQDGTWTAISSTGAPSARFGHSAVWTGDRMIIWGGHNGTAELNDGAAYDPATNTWSALQYIDGLTARTQHSAIWVGNYMLVWGGTSAANPMGFSDGGQYPLNLPWTTLLSGDPVLRRMGHSAVWTGTRMIIFGGVSNNVTQQDGYSFNPDPQSLLFTGLALSPTTPSNRTEHSAVWTGQAMIVWGGVNYGVTTNYLNDGGVFAPAATEGDGQWTPVSTANAPTARAGHTAVWTGNSMIIWGGTDGTSYFNAGGVYR